MERRRKSRLEHRRDRHPEEPRSGVSKDKQRAPAQVILRGSQGLAPPERTQVRSSGDDVLSPAPPPARTAGRSQCARGVLLLATASVSSSTKRWPCSVPCYLPLFRP